MSANAPEGRRDRRGIWSRKVLDKMEDALFEVRQAAAQHLVRLGYTETEADVLVGILPEEERDESRDAG
jgi:hypothetical protein